MTPDVDLRRLAFVHPEDSQRLVFLEKGDRA